MKNINLKDVHSSTFPGGETHVDVSHIMLKKFKEVTLKVNLRNAEDIMKLLLVTDAIRRYKPDTIIHLDMVYIPYARQDRVCKAGEAFSLNVFANIINSQNYSTITALDAHSKVSENLIHNLKVKTNSVYAENAISSSSFKTHKIVLVVPDKGAVGKSLDIYSDWVYRFKTRNVIIDTVRFEKERSPINGKIIGMDFAEDDPHVIDQDAIYYIIDDICDGGRTFVEIGKILKSKGIKDIRLFVTHGIFSNGFKELKKYFSNIYTANNLGSNSKYLKVIGNLENTK